MFSLTDTWERLKIKAGGDLMGEAKVIREPKQQRSIQKKQLVIDTARKLFYKNGYYNTTTNEIAKQAGLSIGTLYSYFADKETILLALLEQYNNASSGFYRLFNSVENALLFQTDLRKWLYCLMDNHIKLRESKRTFYLELKTLYYTIPAVSSVVDMQNEQFRLTIFELLKKYQDSISCSDIEVSSIIIMEFTTVIADKAFVTENSNDRQTLIEMGVETLYKMLRA
jgi:AcrR family transcriptional regulator